MKEQSETTRNFMTVLREAREKCGHKKIPKVECLHCLLGPKSMRFGINLREEVDDFRDEFPEWEEYTVVYKSSRYTLGTYNLWPPHKQHPSVIPEGQEPAAVYAYVHSGVSLSLSGFSCPWDSGQSGYIFGPDSTKYPQVLKDLSAWINGHMYVVDEEHLNPITDEWEYYQSDAYFSDHQAAETYIEEELTEK